MCIFPIGRGKAANIEGKGQEPLTPYLTLPCNQKNGHSEVPMADIDSKIQTLRSVHYQPPFCINSSWKYVSI